MKTKVKIPKGWELLGFLLRPRPQTFIIRRIKTK